MLDIFLKSLTRALQISLNFYVIMGFAVIVIIFFWASLFLHWPREKESRVLKAGYTSFLQAVFSSLFIVIYFPLFFAQVGLTHFQDAINIFIAIGERIMIAGVFIIALSLIPFIGSVMMDLAGLQFYFAGLIIFHACMNLSEKALPNLDVPVLGMGESLVFFLFAVLLSSLFYFLTKFITGIIKGWFKDNLARTASLLGGILSLIAYTQFYFLKIANSL
ncbi:MAG: hypothetical protein JW928_02490 [Candidatus Aureabacteria bacterium]|nr:hypothetical protein [Candidatus Auribacterota bacterium]